MNDITFANPEFFYLFAVIPLMILWYVLRRKRQNPALKMSTATGLFSAKTTWRQRLMHIIPALRIIAVSLLIIALARPQTSSSSKSISTEGIDIVVALDISTSMLAEDFKPNRIEAAKKTAVKFFEERPNDRIGLVVFARESFTQCPVTIDHDVLINLVKSVKSGMIEDGTAIGMGLATAVSRLKESKSDSKVVILLTDGVNNSGFVAPQTAAEIAKTFGIRVYTIGVGSKGTAPYPMKFKTWTGEIITRYQNVKVEIDEDILKEIANTTGGKYFRATNTKALENIYDEIDKMEKTKIDVAYYNKYTEEFYPFAIWAGIAMILELLLRFFLFRTFP